jgi:predicted ribosome quality control (RQC) complex YloA/Tae2 family protein
MYKNYFYLFRCINQLEPIIHGYKIVEAYTQEKDKLFFKIPLPGKPEFHLIVSTNLQHPYITIKDEHHKAKRNTINFFTDFFPSVVESIRIALGDRVIEIKLNNAVITILFRGGQSNIIFTDYQKELHTFKKVSDEAKANLKEEISRLSFIKTYQLLRSSLENSFDEETLKRNRSIGKEILREVELRGGDHKTNLFHVLDEINHEKIAVYFDENSGKPYFHPTTFKSLSIPENHFLFDDYLNALNKYFTLSYSRSKIKNVRKEIEKFLTKEIESLSTKLNNLKGRVDAASKEELYHRTGDMLLANINLIIKGMKEIDLIEYTSGEQCKIKLDEKLSPHQNIDRYYDKARAEKIEFQKSKELLISTQKEFERLVIIRDKFEHTEDQAELLQIKKELKMKAPQSQTDDKWESTTTWKDKKSFRHFLVDGRYHIFVGKDSKNNDMLTTQFAKQNDFWFHARSVSGSHVVLRVENTKEVIPKNILQKTASVAAFYSKAKTSKLVPVTYTLKKYVNKNARHEPGQVTVTKETVLLVKPEIPKGCEIVTD